MISRHSREVEHYLSGLSGGQFVRSGRISLSYLPFFMVTWRWCYLFRRYLFDACFSSTFCVCCLYFAVVEPLCLLSVRLYCLLSVHSLTLLFGYIVFARKFGKVLRVPVGLVLAILDFGCFYLHTAAYMPPLYAFDFSFGCGLPRVFFMGLELYLSCPLALPLVSAFVR